jgi:oligosaccharyltransferase complex subunit alpha (ribophorin I)
LLRAFQGEEQLSVADADDSVFPDMSGLRFFRVQLAASLAAHPIVNVTHVFTGSLSPLPREIQRIENQFVVFNDNLHFLSPYPTETQAVTFLVGTPKIESYTRESPVRAENGNITYGPFLQVPSFSLLPARVHYMNNKPFACALEMKRSLQVSAWGVLTVEETYRVKHVGASLKGGFSRFEYQRSESPAVVPILTAELPNKATEIYYRDDIGNISTSSIRTGAGVELGKLEVDFQPRFPLFGGWQTDFYYGYNLPLSEVVDSDGAIFFTPTYTLSLPLRPSLKNMHVVEMETEVILPEGASNVKVRVGGQVPETESSSLTHTYFDTTGRPTISFRSRNIVSPDNANEIEVVYTFNKMNMLQEPLLMTAVFMAVFILVIFYTRL